MNKQILPLKREIRQSKIERDNNIAILRFAGILLIFTGLMRTTIGEAGFVFAGFHLHEIGLMILFLTSGYLVAQSWRADAHIIHYIIRRFLRLYPPYFVMILLMVFVAGPLVSDLGWREYFKSGYSAYLHNLRFYIVYSQPGVFTEQPVANVTHGALWVMPALVISYSLTPLLFTLLSIKKRKEEAFKDMAAFTALLCVLDILIRIFIGETPVIFYGMNLITVFHLIVIYVIGMLFSFEETRRYLNLQASLVALCVLVIFQPMRDEFRYILLYIIFPYAVMSFALIKRPLFSGFGRQVELSYGIFLYGYFFQQLAVLLRNRLGFSLGQYGFLLFSLFMSCVAAFLSFYFIEKPLFKLREIILKKI